MNEKESEIVEQLKFVSWLKDKGLYNKMESAHTMSRMYDVWKATRRPTSFVHSGYNRI